MSHQKFTDRDLSGFDDESTTESLSSLSDGPNEPSVDQNRQVDEARPSTSSRNPSVVLSVNRNRITSTSIREQTEEELEGLGIEAYDQNVYERKVFEQVDRAISDAGAHGSNDLQTTQNDLINMIQAGNLNHDADSSDESQNNDESLLELTRRERNRLQIKQEKTVHVKCEDGYTIGSNIKIAKLCCDTSLPRVKLEPRETSNPRESDDTHLIDYPSNITLYWTPNFGAADSSTNDQAENDESEYSSRSTASEYAPDDNEESNDDGDDMDVDEDIDYETDVELADPEPRTRVKEKKIRKTKKVIDDGDPHYYKHRMKEYAKKRAEQRYENIREDGVESVQLDEPVKIEGQLQIPKRIWENLFEHQKTAVKWLWELHQLGSGGILGDEMGLGKTIEVTAFLIALRSSNVPSSHKGYQNLGPTVLVCPATVMYQWLLELRKWWPPFRVAILHSTGTYSGDKMLLVKAINKACGILIVSYPGAVIYQDLLHAFDWHYAILDEGHKIRNPDAQVTLACKRFRTPHRLILSGSPVQNNLKELWSIFDFIYPGKLGTLPVFMEQFATPITQGGYANASDFQVQIAYKCSCVLRDTIKPFLMRRTKAEVNNKLKLPDRSEQVLFCKLTERQYQLYDAYLKSSTVRDIKHGLLHIFVGLTQLRKICNHPDLFDTSECIRKGPPKNNIDDLSMMDDNFRSHKKSGKMMVVDALLKIWKKQGHKVLLFTQSRQMLRIFIKYLDEQGYQYLSMDGQTSIGVRQSTIDKFNTTEEIFIFLLTTRVGGIGINLVGANRIIIFDPDWNPSTDIQARERAWRIGQTRQVVIYRLLTAGTIEEKIYHRQVFKLYLTNRILKDAKQKRFFKTNDLHELFTLGDNGKNIETKALFDDDLQINPENLNKSSKKVRRNKKERSERKRTKLKYDTDIKLSDEQIQVMRDQAKRLSQMIASQYGTSTSHGAESTASFQKDATNGSNSPSVANHTVADKRISNPFIPSDVSSAAKRDNDPETGSDKGKRRKERVDFLVRQDVYRPGGSDEAQKAKKEKEEQQDYILERLFRSANVFGALKHDKIEGDTAADYKVVESEAEKVARDAIRVLRESRRMCMGSLSGLPNWTGRNGHLAQSTQTTASSRSSTSSYAQQEAMFHRARPRGPLIRMKHPQVGGSSTSSISTSSSETNSNGSNGGGGSILSMIRKRAQKNPISLVRAAFNAAPNSDDEQEEEERNRVSHGRAEGTGAEVMADKIREFMLIRLSAGDSQIPTDDLLEFFKQNFNSDQTAIFKAILYKMCEFKRLGDTGFWTIKGEFKDQD